MAEIHWIACENLMSAIAAQRYGYVFAREARKQIRRNERRICQRLVHPRANVGNEIRRQTSSKPFLVMISAEKFRNAPRILRFIEGAFRKANRKSLNRLGTRRQHSQRRDHR